jgi:hypothetical protein
MKPKAVTKITRKLTPKQVKILKVKEDHPDLTTREVAALADTDHSHVIKTFQRYGVEHSHIKEFVDNRGKIFSGMQHRLLSSITDDDIKKAPMGSRILAVAQLYDKERIEVGKDQGGINLVINTIQALQQAHPVDNSQSRAIIDQHNVA